jgi:hypothetical protein
VLRAGHPQQAKRLVRQVRGFDEDVWEARRYGIVIAANLAKFGQPERRPRSSSGAAARTRAATRTSQPAKLRHRDRPC